MPVYDFPSNGDTYVRDDDAADLNFGSLQWMGCAPNTVSTPYITRCLIRWDIASFPAPADINSVKLTVYNHPLGYSSGANIYIQRCTADFDEDVVTWNTLPSTTTTNQATCDVATVTAIDITAIYNDAKNAGQSYLSLLLLMVNETSGSSYANYSTEEYGVPSIITIDSDIAISFPNVYVALTGNDNNTGQSLASAKLTLYAGLNILPVSGNLHIGFGDFSAQTSFQIAKSMTWVFDTSGGVGTVTFPTTV